MPNTRMPSTHIPVYTTPIPYAGLCDQCYHITPLSGRITATQTVTVPTLTGARNTQFTNTLLFCSRACESIYMITHGYNRA
jgi:hypothetical protein